MQLRSRACTYCSLNTPRTYDLIMSEELTKIPNS